MTSVSRPRPPSRDAVQHAAPSVGAQEAMRLPSALRDGVKAHLEDLKQAYTARGWGARVGFGQSPAVVVVDLAEAWVDKTSPTIGGDLDSVVENTSLLLDAARRARVPIFFTTMPLDSDHVGPDKHSRREPGSPRLDARLGRRPDEKIIIKEYASAFKGTNLQEMLTWLRVDTLIVVGCSTSHCVYATCRDAASSFRVIVPEEAVGDRSELFHLVNLLDIDMALGDAMPMSEVLRYLEGSFESETTPRARS